MDLIELIEDELDELENYYPQRIPRPRVFNVRINYFADLDEQDFFARFRLSKSAANRVHSLIKDKIKTKTPRNRALPSELRLLLTLRYLATGSYLRTTSDFSGVSSPTASRIVKSVTEAIALLSPIIIKFPEDLSQIQKDFYKIAKFPRVVAALDCTHISIKSPGGNLAENYRNRKTTFSLNVQMACDSQLKCLNIVARWPGSVHDQTIFNNSFLKHKFESGDFGNSLLLGDSGYENNKYLCTPLLNPSTPVEYLYNESHIRTRNTVERCFGVCKNRFPVLRRQITVSLNRVQAIIVACFVLHNIAVECNERHFGDNEDIDNDQHIPEVARQTLPLDTNDARSRLLQEYFLPLYNRMQNHNVN